ncbi:mitochondrial import inner membrane translocase subunit tim16-like [Dendronephthya gigantea]|uniref:mitochondrial import inner membrane translocase subunit tim16-like n=1 Tax=Dendronephthya gigantea TaxID=151771 RepID=UPI00106AC4A9|nr:mitochondrial import inner membrane translocase subunit tim16-like [Dendronephthya gigantea]
MARFIAQIIVLGGQVVARAFTQALRQEFQRGQAAQSAAKTAKEGAKRATTNSMMGISLEEAKQILNVETIDKEAITKSYDHLFKVNEKSGGGSFYIQSKVVRAKERLDAELEATGKETQQNENNDDK